MFESIYAESFLYNVLSTDATLVGATALNGTRIYQGEAPPAVVFPVVIYNMQSGGDVNTLNGLRIFTRPIYQVRTVGKVVNGKLENPDRVKTAANRVDTILADDAAPIRRRSYTVGAVTFFYNVWREEELPDRTEPGETPEIRYRNYAGLYRVEVLP